MFFSHVPGSLPHQVAKFAALWCGSRTLYGAPNLLWCLGSSLWDLRVGQTEDSTLSSLLSGHKGAIPPALITSVLLAFPPTCPMVLKGEAFCFEGDLDLFHCYGHQSVIGSWVQGGFSLPTGLGLGEGAFVYLIAMVFFCLVSPTTSCYGRRGIGLDH